MCIGVQIDTFALFGGHGLMGSNNVIFAGGFPKKDQFTIVNQTRYIQKTFKTVDNTAFGVRGVPNAAAV